MDEEEAEAEGAEGEDEPPSFATAISHSQRLEAARADIVRRDHSLMTQQQLSYCLLVQLHEGKTQRETSKPPPTL